jgi:hypothetical protein
MKPVYKPNDQLSNSENKLITIPEPCHENWNHMTPKEKGRHCDSCDKVVVDFTKSSKDEIVTHLESSSGKTCGRFRSDQIHMPKSIPSKLSKIAASILAIVGANNAVHSQVDFSLKGDVQIEPFEITVSNSISKDISGKIADDENNPIKNAKISVYSGGNLIKSVLSDDEGRYTIELPAGSVIQDIISIKVHATNFNTKTLDHLTLKKTNTSLNISLNQSDLIKPVRNIEMMGGASMIVNPEIESKIGIAKVPIHNERSDSNTTSKSAKKQNRQKLVEEVQSDCSLTNKEIVDKSKPQPGIEKQLTDFSVAVYPNPTSNLAKVQLSTSGEYDYCITDVIGNLIAQGFFIGNTIEFSFRNHKSGIYLFNFKQKGVVVNSIKVIVEK